MQTLTVCVFIAVTLAGAWASHHHYEDNGPAFYKFEYGVNDDHTGDKKSQYEHRDGQHVRGGYTLKEADGTTRVVEYVAGPHTGFNAVVRRIGHAEHPAHYGNGAHHHGGYQHGGFAGYGGHGGHGGSSYVAPTHFGYNHHY